MTMNKIQTLCCVGFVAALVVCVTIIGALIAWAKRESSVAKRVAALGGRVGYRDPAFGTASLAKSLEKVLGPLPRIRRVQSIDCPNGVFDEGVAALILGSVDLEDLKISDPKVDDTFARRLSALKSLHRLTIQSPNVSDDGLQWCATSTSLGSLTVVSPRITGSCLIGTTPFSSLGHIHLCGTRFDDNAASAISRGRHAQVIDVAQSQLTDLGLQEFARLEFLMDVDVSETQVTLEGVKKFQQLKPRVLVRATHLQIDPYPKMK